MVDHPANIPWKAPNTLNWSILQQTRPCRLKSLHLNIKLGKEIKKRRKKARAVKLQHQQAPLSTGTSTTVNLKQEPAICSNKIKCTIDVIHIQTKTVSFTQGVNIKCSKTYINTAYLKHILCLSMYSINPHNNILLSSALKIGTTRLEFDSRHRHKNVLSSF